MSGRGPKLGTGKTLVPVQSVVTEASAFRVTPTYVYAYKYKDGSKAAGIVPVHIKHANVWKHWDDLVDPDPGSPLNNLVIGTIPKYYDNPSQLQPKDPKTKVSDLMSKDGEAGAKEAERIGTPAMPSGGAPATPLADYLKSINFDDASETILKSPTLLAHLEALYGKDWKEKAVAAGFKIKGVKAAPAPVTYAPEVTAMAAVLGYAPNTPEADALQSMFQHGEFALALDEYVKAKGQKKLKKNLEAALPMLMKVYQAAQAKGLVDEAEPDDNGDIALKFHPAKASPVVAAPPPAPAPKPVEPPKPAAVDGLPPTGLIATKATFTSTVGHKAAQSLPISQQQALGLADTDPDDIEVNKTLLGALAGHDPVSSAPLLNHLAQRLAYATDSKVTEKHKEAASNFAARAVQLGLAIDTELGFTAHPKIKAFFTTQGSPAPTPTPEPVPPTPAPAPVSAPAPAQAGLGKLSVPPLATLTSAGIATGLGGVHDKQFLTDKNGNKYLFKPSGGATSAAAGSAYANLAAKVLGPDKVIPVVAGTVAGGGYGSVQPFLMGTKDLSNVPVTSLTGPQLQTLMRERVMDWALSNHDTKAANFILLPDGSVVGVDKEQALKNIGKDSLDLSYKHTPSSPPQLYSQIFDLFQKKKLDVPVVAMLPAIKNIEAISDDEWLAAFQGYFDALPDNQKEAKKKAILARKKNLRKDLEGLVTGLLRARGDIGPEDQFTFEAEEPEPKKKKKNTAGIGALPPEPTSSPSAPPVGSVLSPSPIPDFSSLTTKNEKVAGSTGQSFLFYDGYGKKYVVKQAVSRGGTMKPQPYRAAAQEIFSQVSSVVRPGKSLAVGSIPGGYKGVPATIQPWIENSKPLGKGTSPASLSAPAKKDIAEEHALDWLLSQHDTHGDNLLIRPDGSIVSIDKEQGFKYFMGGFPAGGTTIPPDTKLSTDYHPNAAYGEDEAYYNKFWRAFADGSMDFDPKDMVGAIERIEGIKDSDYTQLLSKFAESAPFKDDSQKVAEFYKRALERKKNIRSDFEGFISGLYEKRTKKKGQYTFAGGWVPADAAAPKAAPTPAQPAPSTLKPLNPTAKGVLGLTGLDIFTPAAYVPPPPPPAPPIPPVPAGFSPPPAGKMWETAPASQFFASGAGGHLYKTKDPKDAAGQPDPNSPNIVLKLSGLSLAEAQEALKQAGVPVVAIKEKSPYVLAVTSKDEWEKLKSSKTPIGILKAIPPPPPPPPPPTNQMVPIPKAGQLKSPEATESVEQIKGIENREIGTAKALLADGGAIEHQTMFVQRRLDTAGKPYYRFSFKLREPTWSKISGGKPDDFHYTRATYDAATDSWKDGPKTGNTTDVFKASSWSAGDSKVRLCNTSDGKKTAMGRVFADIYPQPGKTIEESLKDCLDKMQTGLADEVLRKPTKADREKMNMAALLWSVAPAKMDKLPESKRTADNLRKELNALGYTDEDIASIRQERVAFGYNAPVLPGRYKKIRANNPSFGYVAHGMSTPAKVAGHLRNGSVGIGYRMEMGIGTKGATSSGDNHAPDQTSGGADSLFTVPVSSTDDKAFQWGQIEMVYDPAVVDRLDVYAPLGTDPYGAIDGGLFSGRPALEESGSTGRAEWDFRMGIGPEKILKIRTANAELRNKVIEALKLEGITEFNGQKVEDLVISAPEKTKFYNTYLKPAGY